MDFKINHFVFNNVKKKVLCTNENLNLQEIYVIIS